MKFDLLVEARTSMSNNAEKDFIYIEDNTSTGEGYWVLMKEGAGKSIILFTNLRREIAESFKKRMDNAIGQFKGYRAT